MERHATDRNKIIAHCLFEEGFLSIVYKALLALKYKKNNSIKKQSKKPHLSRNISKMDVSGQFKKVFNRFADGDYHFYYCTPSRMSRVKKQKQKQKTWAADTSSDVLHSRNPVLVGLSNGRASLEYSLAVLYKVSHMHVYFIFLLLGIICEKKIETSHM